MQKQNAKRKEVIQMKLNQDFEDAIREMLEGSKWTLTENGKIVRCEG